MKIYLDYIFFINFIFDFILLFGISLLLKRNVKIFRIVLGAIFGSLSMFLLFISINSFLFLLLKLIFGIIMVIITFNYKDIKYTLNNFFYLMILSIVLGGFLYFVNIETGYDHVGMIFFTNGKSLNVLILILLAILITTFYLKKMKNFKNNNYLYYEVDVFIENKKISLKGFVDTGNNLHDPYFNKPVSILNKNIEINSDKFVFVPYKTIDGQKIMKCYIIEKIYIKNIGFKYNVLLGRANDKFNLSGVDIILNKEMIE